MAVHIVDKEVNVDGTHFRINITEMVKQIIKDSGIRNGHVTIHTNHTTTGIALSVQEDERGLMEDLMIFLKRLIPDDIYYLHDDLRIRTENLGPDERKNAARHLRAALLPTSLSLIFRDGQLCFGTWQSILLLDFNPEQRTTRNLVIQVCGE